MMIVWSTCAAPIVNTRVSLPPTVSRLLRESPSVLAEARAWGFDHGIRRPRSLLHPLDVR